MLNLRIILFSVFIGFENREVFVGEQTVINVEMNESAETLEEVVVTALGVKRQKREIGYSTEKIDAEAVLRSSAQM